ncbi:MAG: RtcB family protein [Bacillota bacterium]|nr:RtcB family protein [Bacillota bacterium]
MSGGAVVSGPLSDLVRLDDYRWLIPKTRQPGMRTEGLIYASAAMLPGIVQDRAHEQVANVACLPGIVGRSLAMPDIHWGYGFAIGGVAATEVDQGVVSPGGVGYDINCGVRILRTNLSAADVRPRLAKLIDAIFAAVPAGVGGQGGLVLKEPELQAVLRDGAAWAVGRGLGRPADLVACEDGGKIGSADPRAVTDKAAKRGLGQLGTLGSGNHFLEIDVVDEIYDQQAAEVFGLRHGQVVLGIHVGSRGLGHQVCADSLETMQKAVVRYGISLPDRQLACAPVKSPEGSRYLGAMAAAANYAWANRQVITDSVRHVLAEVFAQSKDALGLELVYDVAHNIAKIERHSVEGHERTLCVHRKGATRAFPAGHPDVPAPYRAVGQPVLVPGDMGRYSYVLVGTAEAMRQTFGSTCHGAGRLMSRTAAKQNTRGDDVQRDLAAQGIIVRGRSRSGLAEEAPSAYKDVQQVVDVVHGAGISRRVARLRPLGVIKG